MRLRTIEQAYAELLAADPGCALAKTGLRRLVISGRVPSCRMGSKYLLDVDQLPKYLFSDAGDEQAPTTLDGGIRRIGG